MARAALLACLLIGRTRTLAAQSASGADSTDIWKVWASLALGFGDGGGDRHVAGDIAFWVTHDRLAVWMRAAEVSRLFEAGDLSDISVLAGIHSRSEAHVDFVAGLGAGISHGHDNSGGGHREGPVVALGAQLNLN